MEMYPLKTRFLIRLVRCLHQYGASAHRLEGAVASVSSDLNLQCELFYSPTSCFISINDMADEDETRTITKVLRFSPGDINLARLSLADEIATRVAGGELGPAEGIELLKNIETQIPEPTRLMQVFAFGTASASIAALLAASWWDISAATLAGLLIGGLAVFPGALHREGSLEPVAAMVAALVAVCLSPLMPALSREVVVIAGLIMLLPGLGLTTAMAELGTNHLVSGSARLAGSMMTLLKLTFGVVLGTFLGEKFGLVPMGGQVTPVPLWCQWLALPLAGWAFAYLFRVRRGDMFAAILAALAGYLSAKWATASLGPDLGIFGAGLLIAAMSNIFARIWQRPASVVRLPGIILLVPGSMGFRGITELFAKDTLNSLNIVSSMVVILMSLVAGLLFGNVLIHPRRSL